MTLSNATRTAIAAVSRLAEAYDGGATRLSAAQIARERRLKGPFVSKVLSDLARAGIVTSSTGPGGGFALARPPESISVLDVIERFEREETDKRCPFGGGRCGVDRPCPLHDAYRRAEEQMLRFYEETHFGVFVRGDEARV